MTHHPYITGTLLAVGVMLAIICSIGVLVMRDPQQRNQFSATGRHAFDVSHLHCSIR